MKKNEKGFTLVELLAVIVILGLLMAIAIPSVTKYITQSRIKTLTTTMDSYVTAVITQVNNGEYKFSDSTKVFAIPIECISLEKGGQNPFGNWYQANSSYWAYVLVHYDSDNYNYEYGFTFKDDAGYGLYPTLNSKITNSKVKTGYDDLNQPQDGYALEFVTIDKWDGFTNINTSTYLEVLVAESEGQEGNGQYTCTLQQKGDNYEQVEENKENNNVVINTPLYFGKHYEKTTNGVKESYVLYENGAIEMYEDCFLTFLMPEGSVIYNEEQIIYEGEVVANISSDKKKVVFTDGSGEYVLKGDGMCSGTQSQYAGLPMLLPRSKIDSVMYVQNISYNSIKTITLQTSINVPQGIKSFDLSIGQNKKVIGYVTTNADSSYNLYIQGDGALYAPENSYELFAYKNVTKINNLNVLNTSKVTSMEGMFRYIGTTSLNLSNFDTSNVTNMRGMFEAAKVTSLDLSHFKTSKVTNMAEMFDHTSSLQTLNLNGFDTSNVTEMYDMFLELVNLEKLDISSFNTSKVTTMSWMFGAVGRYNPNFTLILGDGFDTSNVTNMTNMFIWAGEASPYFKLDCSNWNVDKVTGNHYWGNDKIIEPIWKN